MAGFDWDLRELARTEPSGEQARIPLPRRSSTASVSPLPGSQPAGNPHEVAVTPGALDGETIILTRYWGDALTFAAFGIPAIGLGSALVPEWLETACTGRDLVLALDRDLDINGWRSEMEYRLGRQAKSCKVIRPSEGLTWKEWLRLDEDGLRAFLNEKLPLAPSLKVGRGSVLLRRTGKKRLPMVRSAPKWLLPLHPK